MTSTDVAESAISSRAMVTLAPAVPLPRLSFPVASMVARWAASSRVTNCPEPVYSKAIGPSLTLQVPSNRSPSTDVTVAPGKHAATPARSMNVSHVVPTGAGTVNWC